jgi:hypothetical protein
LCHPTLDAAREILRRICINERSKLHIADEMTTYPEVSLHWLPPAYRVEQSDILLVLRRRGGSVTHTFDGQWTVAETVESYAGEDSTKRESRLERTYELFLELRWPAVLGLPWLLGTILMGLCAAAIYSLWTML